MTAGTRPTPGTDTPRRRSVRVAVSADHNIALLTTTHRMLARACCLAADVPPTWSKVGGGWVIGLADLPDVRAQLEAAGFAVIGGRP